MVSPSSLFVVVTLTVVSFAAPAPVMIKRAPAPFTINAAWVGKPGCSFTKEWDDDLPWHTWFQGEKHKTYELCCTKPIFELDDPFKGVNCWNAYGPNSKNT